MLHKEQWIVALVSTLITLLALLPAGYALSNHIPPRIATVDLQKLIEEDQQRVLNQMAQGGSATQEQRMLMQGLTTDFAKKLSKTVEVLGQQCGCVLVNRSALLNGEAIDYTDWVRQRVQR